MASTKVITGVVRLMYPSLFEPKAFDAKSEAKYEATILVRKKDKKTIAAIHAAAQAAIDEEEEKNGAKAVKGIEFELKDGDEEHPDNPAYAGHFFLRLKSKQPPGVVDQDGDEILNKDEIYSGCYVRTSFYFRVYNKTGKGLMTVLLNVKKMEDGERIGGMRSTPADDFED